MPPPRTQPPAPGTRPPGVAAEDAPRYVRQLFDRIAPRYDRANHWLSLGVDRYWRRRAAATVDHWLAAAPAHPPGVMAAAAPVLLDICCGTGDLAFALARRSARRRLGWRIVGADFSPCMLALARAKSRLRTSPAATALPAGWLRADGLCLPVPDAAAAALTTAFGFRNLANYRAALAEFARVLRPGGVLAILEFSAPVVPGLRAAYGWYFHRLLPRLGAWISGTGEPYTYLPSSVDRFPAPAELAVWMAAAGFSAVEFHRLSGGIATLHLARREAASAPHPTSHTPHLSE